MSAASVTPPAIAEWLLAVSLRPEERQAVLGDLHEEFAEKALDGRGAARRWYWHQVIASLGANLRRRVRPFRGDAPRLPKESMMHAFTSDIRFAIRMLGRRPLLTAAAVLSLALGIGLSSGVFGLLEAAVLRPLPVRSPDELRVILEIRDSGENHNFSYPGYAAYRDAQQSFSDVIALSEQQAALRTESGSEPITGEIVSGNFFGAIGPRMQLGRGLTEADDAPGTPPVVVLSAAEWRERFGDAREIGRTSAVINNVSFAVVGVTAPGFRGLRVGDDARFWVSLAHQPLLRPGPAGDLLVKSSAGWLTVIGRLRPGVADAAAIAELNAAGRPMARTASGEPNFTLVPGGQGDSMLPEIVGSPLRLLLGAAALVLLVACANVAGLLLARAHERGREIAVRAALGASRWRLSRLLLIEAATLGLAGAALGVVAARWMAPLMVGFFSQFGQPVTLDVALNLPVVGFAAALGLTASIVSGLVPATRLSAAASGSQLQGGDRSDTGSRATSTWRRALVVAQFALTLALVSASALLVRTLLNLRSIPTGVDVGHVAMIETDPAAAQYRGAQARQYLDRVVEQLRAMPGVRASSYALVPPVSFGGLRMSIQVPAYAPAADEDMEINANVVGPDYFDAVGIDIVDGRALTAADGGDGAPPVAVVNETMARRYWPGGRAVGRMFALDEGRNSPTVEVVGVARDIKYRSLREASRPSFYAPAGPLPMTPGVVHVRTSGDPVAMLESLRRATAAIDPLVPIVSVRTIRDQISAAVNREELTMIIGITLGASAVLLSAVGLFAAMANMVGRRTREIGVRLALGAQPGDVGRMVLREGVVLAVTGSAVGLGLAYWLGRLIESRLYGVGTFDPISLAASMLLLSFVAIVAAWSPARRAAHVDPLTALRNE